jgi:hypothetical protein
MRRHRSNTLDERCPPDVSRGEDRVHGVLAPTPRTRGEAEADELLLLLLEPRRDRPTARALAARALSLARRTTEKSRPDSLTSGESTVMPIARASAMNLTTLSLFDLSQVISAAMNEAGKWCLRNAVW